MDILEQAIKRNGVKARINDKDIELLIKPCLDIYTHSPIIQGDIIEIDKVNYIVIESDDNLVTTYNKATITKAQPVIYNKKKIFAFVRSLKDVIANNPNFLELANQLEIVVSDKDKLEVNESFSYKNMDYKIINIDNTKENLLSVIAKYTGTSLIPPVKPDPTPVIPPKEDKPIEPPKPPKPVEPVKPVEEDFNGKFTITGEKKMKFGTKSTYKLVPNRKTVQFKLEDSKYGVIESQGNGECVLKVNGTEMGYIFLNGYSPSGKLLATAHILAF